MERKIRQRGGISLELRRFKTVLIFILALILAAAVIFYVRIIENDSSINREYENGIMSLLDDSNISVESMLINQQNRTVKNLYIELCDCRSEKFAASVLGGGYAETSYGVFEKEGRALRCETNSAVYTEEGEPTQGGGQERCSAYLRSLGVDLNLYKFSFGQGTETSYSAKYTAHFEDCEIFDSYITVEISPELTKVTFENPIEECRAAGGSSTVFSEAGILAELPENPQMIEKGKITVTDLKLGAEIASDRELRSVFTIPVWRVETDKAGVLRYDARSGRILE